MDRPEDASLNDFSLAELRDLVGRLIGRTDRKPEQGQALRFRRTADLLGRGPGYSPGPEMGIPRARKEAPSTPSPLVTMAAAANRLVQLGSRAAERCRSLRLRTGLTFGKTSECSSFFVANSYFGTRSHHGLRYTALRRH